jgi:hypothetical protein
VNNLMLDLEAMGKKPNAPIVSIAAVFFEPATGEIGNQFYAVVELDSEIALGAVPDADTIMWWLRQSSEARAAICSNPERIADVLVQLSKFALMHADDPGTLSVWGNGASFDNVILRGAYERCHHIVFWNWYNDRDVRTIVDLGRAVGFDPKRNMTFYGERHNALADAIHQAKYVSAIYQRLIPPAVVE